MGVLVHQSLKPSLQCAKAAAKANQVLGQLARAVTYRDKQTFLKLYTVYAVASWCPWSKEDREILEKVQNHALNMISNFKFKDYEKKLAEAGMISLEQRRERGDLIVMYRIMTGKDDVPHTTWFQKMADRDSNGVNTRTATGALNVLPPGQSKTKVRKFFFSQRVVENGTSFLTLSSRQ